MRISILVLSVLMTVSVTLPTPLNAQPARYSDTDLASWSIDQWIASLDGKRSRLDPTSPIVLDYSQPSPGRDQLELGNPRSFSRWCELNRGSTASTPKIGVKLHEIFQTGVPYSAYAQAALQRDGALLKLPDEDGAGEWYFRSCSDGGSEGLGSFAYVAATRCFPDKLGSKTGVRCRSLVYDEMAMKPLRDIVDAEFAKFEQARRTKAKTEAQRLQAWRQNIRPGAISQMGLVVVVNGAVAQVQDAHGETRWFSVSDLQPAQ